MLFRLEQLSDRIDLGLLLLDFRIGGSIGREFCGDGEVLRAPIALPRGVRLGARIDTLLSLDGGMP